MKSPAINGLIFDQASIRAIKDIKERQGRANVLATLLPGSVFFEIFGGRGGVGHPLEYAWNISQYDWITWSQAMAAIPAVLRGTIQRIASFEAEAHFRSRKEHDFWVAVAYACG